MYLKVKEANSGEGVVLTEVVRQDPRNRQFNEDLISCCFNLFCAAQMWHYRSLSPLHFTQYSHFCQAPSSRFQAGINQTAKSLETKMGVWTLELDFGELGAVGGCHRGQRL